MSRDDDTSSLFGQALQLVRSSWVPAERPPLNSHPRAWQPRLAVPGEGPIEGSRGDLWDTASALADGRTTIGEVVAGVRARIADHDGALRAFVHVDHEALDAAASLTGGEDRGDLWGVPVSVKDIVDVAGLPTSGSTLAVPTVVANADATAVARLRAAGAIIAGKVETHELALGVTTPQSANPWAPDRVPGGSSGGSAISVVTGMAFGSVGTDTRASIRVPPALSGGVGIRPSLGLVPLDGWRPLSWSMDTLAPIARTVRDAALLLDVMSGSGRRFRSVLPGTVAGLRLGLARATVAGCEEAVAARFEELVTALIDEGAKVVESAEPLANDMALANAVGIVLSRAEAAHYHSEVGTNLALCSPEVRNQLQAASSLGAGDYLRALRLRGELMERMARPFADVDLMVMPTCKATAPHHNDADRFLLRLSENCVPWSLVDLPAATVFGGFANGLPIGLELVGPPGCDDLVVSAAHGVERVIGPLPPWPPKPA